MSERIDFEKNATTYLESLGYLVIKRLAPETQAEVRAKTRIMYLTMGDRKNKNANSTV